MKKSKFDIIKCSKELKKVILKRNEELGYSFKWVCKNADIDLRMFSIYLNSADPFDANIRVSQWEIIQVCDQLGIDLKIQIIIKDAETTRQYNKQRYSGSK